MNSSGQNYSADERSRLEGLIKSGLRNPNTRPKMEAAIRFVAQMAGLSMPLLPSDVEKPAGEMSAQVEVGDVNDLDTQSLTDRIHHEVDAHPETRGILTAAKVAHCVTNVFIK